MVLAGTHGGESRLARTILEGVIQLAHPGQERYRLLEKGTILFDPIVDPAGFNNQTRGAVTRGGPGNSTEVISLHLYYIALNFFHLGTAAAISFIVIAFAKDSLKVCRKNWRRRR